MCATTRILISNKTQASPGDDASKKYYFSNSVFRKQKKKKNTKKRFSFFALVLLFSFIWSFFWVKKATEDKHRLRCRLKLNVNPTTNVYIFYICVSQHVSQVRVFFLSTRQLLCFYLKYRIFFLLKCTLFQLYT